MKIFLNHSTKNKKIALKFADFLESLSGEIEVFCSSEKENISTGQNFNKVIFSELSLCNVFIPLLSKEFFESKYCMFELGFAYCYYCTRDNMQDEYILPFLLPPLSKEEALKGTPLADMQISEINKKESMHNLIQWLKGKNNIDIVAKANSKASLCVSEIEQILLQEQNFYKNARIIACCDMSNQLDDVRENDIINYNSDKGSIVVNYDFNPKKHKRLKRASFISLVLGFVDRIDILKYLKVNINSNFKFLLTNSTGSLKNIFIEFKYSDTHNILKKFEIPLEAGENSISISLAEMKSDALAKITEICFVVHPTDVYDDRGTYCISNIEIS